MQARVPLSVCKEIARWHTVTCLPYSRGGLAFVHAIAMYPDTGSVTGAADSGGDNMAVCV